MESMQNIKELKREFYLSKRSFAEQCCFKNCTNNVKVVQNDKVVFHTFPHDDNLQKEWLKRCQVDTKEISNSVVCSDHFSVNQYEHNIKVSGALKKSAIPNKYFESERRYALESNAALRVELAIVEQEAVSIQKAKTKLLKQIALHKKKIQIKQMKNILTKVFSDAQIDILRGKKKTRWSDEDLAMAFTLRHMSNRECYLYLKTTLNYPLPALSCVQKWATATE